MKKHFLLLASLVLGLGQLFADEVTFDASVLWQSLGGSGTQAQEVTTPYTWKASPYYVTVTFDGSGTQTVNTTNVPVAKEKSFTVVGATTGTTISKVTFTLNKSGQKNNASVETGTYDGNTLTWTPEEGTTPSSVTFTTTGTFEVKTIKVEYTAGEAPDVEPDPVVPTATMGDPIEAIAIDDINTYTGSEPYVYSKANYTYYVLNNLGQYEEYGLFTEVSTLKVAGGGATEIEYIATTESDGKHPYINTNYIPKANTRIVMDVDIANSTAKGWMAVFGARQGGWTSHAFVLFARAWDNQKGCYNRTNDEHAADSDIPRDQRMTIDAFEKTCTFTLAGQTDPALTITTKDESTVEDCTNNLFIFDTNTGGANENRRDDSYIYMKLYGCQIYEGETLVRDFVPIVDSEGNGGLKDKVTGEIIISATSDNFVLSADGQAVAASAGISVYEGKRVKLTTENHEYKYQDGQWLDCGAMALEEITDTDPSYKDMRNWKTNNDHMSIFAGFTYDGTTNEINPYVGTGGYEPYMFQIPTIAGEDYNWSFIYSGSAYDSWHSTPVHAFVANDYNLGTTETGASYNNNVIGIAEAFPFAGVENKDYSIDFTAKQNNETLVVQFGDANDGKNFWFKFANLKVSKYIYPLAYEEIDFVAPDDNKYTPLAYIESTGAVKENAFTTTYIAKASTEVDIKFNLYSNNGWAAIFSGRNGTDAGTGISLYKNGGSDKFGYFVGGYRQDNFADFPGFNQDITVEASLSGLVVNGGEKVETGQTSFASSTRGISMFANPEWDEPIRGRIYYMTIKEDGTTVYDFQPVMRHDGVYGFYDRKTATFVQPAKGNWDGYNYALLEDEAYVTYTDETRIVIVGSTAQYLPTVQNLDGATFTWESSDEAIATVAADGTVTGVAGGTVTITVTTDADEGWTAQYELTVSEPEYLRRDINNVGYAIVTGGNGWGDSPLSALLDNDAATKFGCSNASDAWAIMIASEPVAVKQYSFVTGADTYDNPGRTPRNWKLEGSNDNKTWTIIDEQIQNYKAKTSSMEETVFTVNGTDTYKFFKFTADNFNGGFQLGEFWINEQALDFVEKAEARVEATCTTEGKVVYEDAATHVLYVKPISLLPHTYENSICTVCGGKVSEPVLLANGQTAPFIAKFRHAIGVSDDEYVDIEEGWNTADFDDSEWDEMLLPLGTYGPYKTRWIAEYNTFWFRRTFEIDNPSAITKLIVKTSHDDDYAVFINGKKVGNATGWTANENDWHMIEIEPANVDLVEGTNVLAVYIEQNFGGAYCDFSLEAQVGATVEVSDAGYATFVAPVDVDFTGAEVTAKAATVEGQYVILTDVNTVPAGTAVVVKAAEGTYTVPAITGAALGTANELKASTGEGVETDGTQYILAKVDGKVGFAKAAGGVIAAGKGYLVIESSESSEVRDFYGFEPDDATGISELNGQWQTAEGQPVYNLAGQRIGKVQKGINIVNGKKVLR